MAGIYFVLLDTDHQNVVVLRRWKNREEFTLWIRLAFIIEFFKDLFFDTKEEGHFSSSKFNTRKFTVFLLVLSLFSFCSFTINRTFVLTKKVVELNKEIEAYKQHEQQLMTQLKEISKDPVAPVLTKPEPPNLIKEVKPNEAKEIDKKDRK